jgi:hypothetical protein
LSSARWNAETDYKRRAVAKRGIVEADYRGWRFTAAVADLSAHASAEEQQLGPLA